MMETVLLATAAVVLTVLWWIVAASPKTGKTDGEASSSALPSGVVITSVPLLTETEIILYNLMQMAVQDHYLVLAQVPLWSFVSVETMGKARSQVLNRIALKRVDFVLVHPGSRQVEQVVQIEEASSHPHQLERQRVVESVLDAAGIKLVKLRSQKAYTIPDLATLFGLAAEE
jgi:hypothetical protein